MGNTNVREGGGRICEEEAGGEPHHGGPVHGQRETGKLSHGGSAESMGHSPPDSPGRSRSPVMFASQVPVAPLQNSAEPVPNQSWAYNSSASEDIYYEKGIPTMITWSYGGNDVAVEGSWDNWTSRKPLHRAGKDFTIMLVLPSGVYQYKFIIDGEWRYVPDLPCDNLQPFCQKQPGPKDFLSYLGISGAPFAQVKSESVEDNMKSSDNFSRPFGGFAELDILATQLDSGSMRSELHIMDDPTITQTDTYRGVLKTPSIGGGFSSFL